MAIGTLNGAVKTAQDEYERQLRRAKPDLPPICSAEASGIYLDCSTHPIYNALVLIGILVFLSALSLVMLYRRF